MYALTKHISGVFKLYNHGIGKDHVSCSKPIQIILGKNSDQCGLHMKLISNKALNSITPEVT